MQEDCSLGCFTSRTAAEPKNIRAPPAFHERPLLIINHGNAEHFFGEANRVFTPLIDYLCRLFIFLNLTLRPFGWCSWHINFHYEPPRFLLADDSAIRFSRLFLSCLFSSSSASAFSRRSVSMVRCSFSISV